MKKLLPVLALLCTSSLLMAQITVTNSTFPAVGDTLKTRTQLMPSGIEIGPAGSNLSWDFTSLNSVLTNSTVFLDASAGTVVASLPNATHVTIDATTGAEGYFQITGQEIRFLAANGNDPTGFGISALFRFTPPIVQRRAPMTYPSVNSNNSNLLIAFAWSDLPPILTDSLPLPITPDSLRVRVVQERDDFVDAWGTLSIPGGEYEVLREKRTQYTETRVDIYIVIPFIGGQWQDVTDLLLSGGGFDGLGMDTTITYNYFSKDEKEIIAVMTMDNSEQNVTQATYKDNGVVSSTTQQLSQGPIVWVMPNPVADVVRFGLQDFPQGNVSMSIFSSTGVVLEKRKIQVISSDQTEQLDLSHCPSGNYFFQFTDDRGQAIASGKLMKL